MPFVVKASISSLWLEISVYKTCYSRVMFCFYEHRQVLGWRTVKIFTSHSNIYMRQTCIKSLVSVLSWKSCTSFKPLSSFLLASFEGHVNVYASSLLGLHYFWVNWASLVKFLNLKEDGFQILNFLLRCLNWQHFYILFQIIDSLL